jgi:hypothetical protein
MRRFGLTCDNLLGAEMVTAGGEIVRTDAEQNPELLWALRGGGENLGVVTTFELGLHEAGPEVHFLMPVYPAERGRDALKSFDELIRNAPDELGAIAFFGHQPDDGRLPPQARDREVLVIYGCYTGPEERAEEVTGPFRSLKGLLADFSGPKPFTEVQRYLDEDYPNGARYYWRSLYLDSLDQPVADTIQRHAALRPSPDSTLDVWALGGAVGRVDPGATAFRHRRAPYMLAVEANWESPAEDRRNVAWAREVIRDMERFSSSGSYLNFAGSAVESDAAKAAAYGPNLERLRRIKRSWDPANLFG